MKLLSSRRNIEIKGNWSLLKTLKLSLTLNFLSLTRNKWPWNETAELNKKQLIVWRLETAELNKKQLIVWRLETAELNKKQLIVWRLETKTTVQLHLCWHYCMYCTKSTNFALFINQLHKWKRNILPIYSSKESQPWRCSLTIELWK